jgi:hypothetical protein
MRSWAVILCPNCVDYIISDVSMKRGKERNKRLKREREWDRGNGIKAINYLSDRWDMAR